MSRTFITNVFVTEEEIAKMIAEISEGNSTASGDFFARFGLGELMKTGRFFEALDKGRDLLHLCHRLNQETYSKMHKGAPFYWMGMASYRIHDFTSAIYFIDAAVSEDLKNHPHIINSPARLFLRLEGEVGDQAAKPLVQGAQNQIEKHIKLYNEIIENSKETFPPLTMPLIRQYLLTPAAASRFPEDRSLASTFVTFFLEFDYRFFQLMLRPEAGTNEPFFIHLFKGCLLFESILKKNPSSTVKGSTLRAALTELAPKLGLPKKINISAANLECVLKDTEAVDDTISSAIITTGKLRNTLGHNLGWPDQLTLKQYINGFLLIAISCLHAISLLYRNETE